MFPKTLYLIFARGNIIFDKTILNSPHFIALFSSFYKSNKVIQIAQTLFDEEIRTRKSAYSASALAPFFGKLLVALFVTEWSNVMNNSFEHQKSMFGKSSPRLTKAPFARLRIIC